MNAFRRGKYALLAILLIGATEGRAENWLTRTGDHESFFMRLAISNMSTKSLDWTYQGASGTKEVGVPIRFWMGWSVAPRWILHVSLLDMLVERGKDADINAASFGPGLTCYVPGNIFLSGQAGFSPLTKNMGTLGGARWTLAAGKEIQVSRNNGIGIMLSYDGGSWKDGAFDEEWTLGAPGIQFVWTVN